MCQALGKETIDTNTYGKSSGRVVTIQQIIRFRGVELMTQTKCVCLITVALLFVRGERPVMDFKYDILKHPNVKLTDG